MEEDLLLATEQPRRWDYILADEVKKTCYIALPMVVVLVSQNLLGVSSIMMVGRRGELDLAGTAIAASITNVTGFSLLFGLASGLETLCGQAYGAGQYEKVGRYTFIAIVCLILVCFPISILWIYIDKLLILLGQDPLISRKACRFAVWLIPALFPYSVLQLINRYLVSQSLIFPLLWSSTAVLILHVPVCWALVFKLELGAVGAALAIGISYTLNVIFLGVYLYQSKECEKTRLTCSVNFYSNIKEFIRFTIPSAIMICLEWSSYEILVLLAGLLPNPRLETSVLAICLTVDISHYYIPYSLGVAASTRISNELGAGNPKAAKIALLVASALGVLEAIIAGTILFCSRSVLGYAFGNDKELVDYVKDITILLCFSTFADAIQQILAGVARGSGWQHIGVYISLGSYYLIGIPMALVLGFSLHLNGKGLWSGLIIGILSQYALCLRSLHVLLIGKTRPERQDSGCLRRRFLTRNNTSSKWANRTSKNI